MNLKNFLGAILSLSLLFGNTISANAATEKTKSVQHKKTIKPVLKKQTTVAAKKTKIQKTAKRKEINKTPLAKKTNVANKKFRANVSQSSYAPRNIKYAVFNYENGQILEANDADVAWPIASLTKLMTAYVFINNIPDLNNCSTTITDEDQDNIKGTHTRLSFYKPYDCQTLLKVMLIASDNYAASALARAVPGWNKPTFIKNMNLQAQKWGLTNTKFVDSSGLSPNNYSSVEDYSKLTMNVVKNKVISNYSSETYVVAENKWNRPITYKNSSKLVREYGFDVNLSKTGFIRESGYNLVHLANCHNPIGVVQFGARSSEQRASFVRQKLSKYGCA